MSNGPMHGQVNGAVNGQGRPDVEPGDPDGLDVVLATTPLQVEAAYDVRTKVFVDEQGVPPELEMDAQDDHADHLLATRDGRPVGAGRLVVEPAGFAGADPTLGDVAHLGRLAVLPDARGTGLGVALVRAVEARAAERGLVLVVLAAQTHALGFYERLGYEPYGDVFDDAGLPHRMMRKHL
ncbi:MAG: GNAT family N-acetyltransferase [Actinomycetes bacterium]